ncbi:MAG: tripartite tricarboxylate transporter substrate binding protein [Betaproteobacteria bacterium]
MKSEFLTAFGLLAALAFPLDSPAQPYPSKTVRIVVAFAPGGATDLIARTLAKKLTEAWGQSVVVENRAGASGIIGTESVAKSAPDGYSLLLATQTTHAANPGLYRKLPYDPVRDFAPVTLVGSTPLALVAHPSVPANTLRELIDYLKKNPGKVSYAGGNGTSQHLTAELFKTLAGVDIVHIPYKGAAPGMADLLAGHVVLMFDNLPTALPHVRAGKLKIFAVTSAARTALAPDVPTLDESGLAGYAVVTWFGVFAPANTPHDVVAKINGEIVRILRLPEIRQSLGGQGVELVGNLPDEFAAFHRNELEKWSKMIKDSGAKLD